MSSQSNVYETASAAPDPPQSDAVADRSMRASDGWRRLAGAIAEPPTEAVRWVILLGYVTVIIIVALHHEPWRDEADPWLLCRDATPAQILHVLPRMGMPPLWFAVLLPFAKLGLPYFTLTAINLAISMAAVALLLWNARLPMAAIVLLAFCYYLGYEYAVIARSYGLSVLLLFAVASCYQSRHVRAIRYAIIVALLANTNPHAFVIAGVVAVVWLWEAIQSRSVNVPAAAILASGLAVVVGILIPRSDAQQAGRLHAFRSAPLFDAIGQAFSPFASSSIALVLGMAVLVATMLAIRHDRAALLIAIGSFAGLGFIYSFVWVGGLRHYGFLLLTVVFVLWIAGSGRRDTSYLLATMLLAMTLAMSTIAAALHWNLDIRYAFSGAKEMGQFIATHRLDRLPIAAHNATQCEAVLPYLHRRAFWYAGVEQNGSYMTWDRRFERGLDTPYPVAERRALEHFGGRPFLLLFNVEMPDPAHHGFRLLYETRRPIFEKHDEHYWLYEPLDVAPPPPVQIASARPVGREAR